MRLSARRCEAKRAAAAARAAYEARMALVAKLEAAFLAVPWPQREAVQDAAIAVIRESYDRGEWEHGDGLLQLLPAPVAMALLDEYFGPLEGS